MPAPKKPDLTLFGGLRTPVVPYRSGATRPTMTPTRLIFHSADRTARAAVNAALINNNYTINDNISTPYSGNAIIQINTLPGSPLDFWTNTSANLTYKLTLNTDGTISFSVIDSGGTSTIQTTQALAVGWAYELAWSYTYVTGGGNKETFMFLYINGRIAAVTVTSSSAAVVSVSTLTASTMVFTATGMAIAAWSVFYFYAWRAAVVWWMWWVYSWWYWYYWWYWWYWWYMWIIIRAAVSGDPHFVGFRGQKFLFNGEIDKHFNLLSDSDIQINAFFRYWHTSGNDNLTAIENIGIVYGDNRIQINANDKCTINGDEILESSNLGDATLKVIDKLKIDVKEYEGFGDFIKGYVLETKNYVFMITICTDHVNPNFLNFIGTLKNEQVCPHGIIGQTTKPSNATDGIQGEGIVEGSYKDYEVSSLWDSDFTFNKFKK